MDPSGGDIPTTRLLRWIAFRGPNNYPSQALLNANGIHNVTVVMAAAESKELAMLKEVVKCVQDHIPSQQKVSSMEAPEQQLSPMMRNCSRFCVERRLVAS